MPVVEIFFYSKNKSITNACHHLAAEGYPGPLYLAEAMGLKLSTSLQSVSGKKQHCLIVLSLLVQLQLLHVGDDSLVLCQPPAIHICAPLRQGPQGACRGLGGLSLTCARLLFPQSGTHCQPAEYSILIVLQGQASQLPGSSLALQPFCRPPPRYPLAHSQKNCMQKQAGLCT